MKIKRIAILILVLVTFTAGTTVFLSTAGQESPVTSLSEERLEQLIFESLDYIIYMDAFKVASIERLCNEGGRRCLRSII